MKLSDEEQFAVSVLFPKATGLDLRVRQALTEAHVIEREFTGVGFFSTIALPFSITQSECGSRDWTFRHPELQLGGSFMGTISANGVVELEGVALAGEWPRQFDAHKFSES